MRRRTKDRGHQSNHDGRIQTEARVHTRNQSVSHGLGQRDCGYGHARQQIVPYVSPGVVDLHCFCPDCSTVGWMASKMPLSAKNFSCASSHPLARMVMGKRSIL